MRYTETIDRAIRFAIEEHEANHRLRRKGKDIPYVIHPLTVGIILSLAGADDEVVAAGILHDTIEESSDAFPVTAAALEKLFGARVAGLVDSVTISEHGRSWEDRKRESLERIATYDHESILVRSADIIANERELKFDHEQIGDRVWNRFNAPKEARIHHQLLMITALLERWSESPLAPDLHATASDLRSMLDNSRQPRSDAG